MNHDQQLFSKNSKVTPIFKKDLKLNAFITDLFPSYLISIKYLKELRMSTDTNS